MISEETLKALMLGTARHAIPTESVSNAEAVSEAQFLIEFAASGLRQRAGYVPMHDPRAIKDVAPNESTRECSAESMRHLNLMLQYKHWQALQEWFIAVIEAHVHVRAEVLPRLLYLGLRKPALRPFLLPILGERGLWLAIEIKNQNWKWVFSTSPDEWREIVAKHHREQRAKAKTFNHKTVHAWETEFKRCNTFGVWSDVLVNAILTNMSQLEVPKYKGWGSFYVKTFTDAAYFYPLGRADEILRRFMDAAVFTPDLNDLPKMTKGILDFRRDMLAALKGDAE
jgi:hypothetical protein